MKYMVAVYHPTDYDGSKEDQSMIRDIDSLNEEMQAAGVRISADGLQPPRLAKSVKAQSNGEFLITDGPYLETKELIGGFWVLDVADEAEALAWARKAAVACRTPVEVRPFYQRHPAAGG